MSHQKKWISVATISASFLFALSAAPVIAHGPGHDDDHGHDQCRHCEKKLSKMDTDKDGKISRREFMKFHGEKFDKHDLNDDRFLDMDEIHWMMEDMHKHMKGKDHGKDHGHGHGHGHGDDHGKDHGQGHGHDDEEIENSPHGSHGEATHDSDDKEDTHANH